MKNRTVLGLICMVLAIITVFAVSPLVNRLTSGETTVLRLAEDVKQGTKITAKQIEMPAPIAPTYRQITKEIPTLIKFAIKLIIALYFILFSAIS